MGTLLDSRQPSLANSPGITVLGGRSIDPSLSHENLPLRNDVPLMVSLAVGAQAQIASFFASEGETIVHPGTGAVLRGADPGAAAEGVELHAVNRRGANHSLDSGSLRVRAHSDLNLSEGVWL